jgi:3-methyladenine DNA glycosylase/8-oxoguanine DNA glycosylase
LVYAVVEAGCVPVNSLSDRLKILYNSFKSPSTLTKLGPMLLVNAKMSGFRVRYVQSTAEKEVEGSVRNL